jgi:drug/metabolite transporter (DMT)-like permease
MKRATSENKLTSHNTLAHVLLVCVTFVWGATFPLVKAALTDISPMRFNLVRMVLAFAVLAAVNWRSLAGLRARDFGFGAVAGFFLAGGYQLQTLGLGKTTASKAAFITGLIVVMVPLLQMIPGVTHGEAKRSVWVILVSSVIAFAGLVLLTTPPGSGKDILAGIGVGELLCLGCALAFSFHLLTLARAAKVMEARRLGTLQIGFCALTMLMTAPLEGRAEMHFTTRVVIALAVTAVLATAAAFTIQSYAQRHLPASHIALIFTLEPVFAWLIALLFLGEHLGARALLGAGAILGGILMSELAPGQGEEAQIVNQASEVPIVLHGE